MIDSETPRRRPAAHGLRFIAALLLLAPAAGDAQQPVKKWHVLTNAPAAGPSRDGYEGTGFAFDYSFRFCSGVPTLLWGARPASVSSHAGYAYWYKGTRYAARQEAPERTPSIRAVRVRILFGASVIESYEVSAPAYVSDAEVTNCLSGAQTNYLDAPRKYDPSFPSSATDRQRLDLLNRFSVELALVEPLRNRNAEMAIEREIRVARDKARQDSIVVARRADSTARAARARELAARASSDSAERAARVERERREQAARGRPTTGAGQAAAESAARSDRTARAPAAQERAAHERAAREEAARERAEREESARRTAELARRGAEARDRMWQLAEAHQADGNFEQARGYYQTLANDTSPENPYRAQAQARLQAIQNAQIEQAAEAIAIAAVPIAEGVGRALGAIADELHTNYPGFTFGVAYMATPYEQGTGGVAAVSMGISAPELLPSIVYLDIGMGVGGTDEQIGDVESNMGWGIGGSIPQLHVGVAGDTPLVSGLWGPTVGFRQVSAFRKTSEFNFDDISLNRPTLGVMRRGKSSLMRVEWIPGAERTSFLYSLGMVF